MLAPHTTMCMGAESFYGGEQESAARGDLYLLTVDLPVCKVSPVILHGVVSREGIPPGTLQYASTWSPMETLDPKTSTLNPQPLTLNPQPSTLIPEP